MIDAAENFSSFEVVVDHLGRFQKRNRSILWLGTQPSSILEKLHENLNIQLENKVGLEQDNHPFTPHITLGRNIQFEKGWTDLKEKILVPNMTAAVSAVTLFQSTRVEGELKYLPIEAVHLNN